MVRFAGLVALGCMSRLVILKIHDKLIRRDFIPKLYGLPLVGSFISLIQDQEHFVLKVLPKYGDLVNFWVFNMAVYVINDRQLMIKVMKLAENRHAMFEKLFKFHKLESNMASTNKNWHLRHSVMNTAISKALGQSTVSKMICDNLHTILENELESIASNNLNNKKEILWYPRDCIEKILFSTNYIAAFGVSLNYKNNKHFEKYKKFSLSMKQALSLFLPATAATEFERKFGIKFCMLDNFNNKFSSSVNCMISMIGDEISKRSKSISTSSNDINNYNDINSMINVYRSHNIDNIKNGNYNGVISESEIIADLALDVVGSSCTTVAHVIEIAILLSAKHPKIQEKVYQELLRVYKCDNSKFNFDKVTQCVLFRAFVNEAIRLSLVSLISPFRTCEKDIRCVKFKYKNSKKKDIFVDFCDSPKWDEIFLLDRKDNIKVCYDYIIKKNTLISGNLGGLSNKYHDELNVNLNNWIEKRENCKLVFKHNNKYLPFSCGKRECIGQILAIKQVQAFLANLLLNHKIIQYRPIKIHFNFSLFTSIKNPTPVVIEPRQK